MTGMLNAVVASVLLLSSASYAAAQVERASVTGTVKDQSDAVVPGATVTAVSSVREALALLDRRYSACTSAPTSPRRQSPMHRVVTSSRRSSPASTSSTSSCRDSASRASA